MPVGLYLTRNNDGTLCSNLMDERQLEECEPGIIVERDEPTDGDARALLAALHAVDRSARSSVGLDDLFAKVREWSLRESRFEFVT
jgi:hypothetical protein